MSDEEKRQQDEPRLHVDEDWKQSVQDEKERLRTEETADQSEPAPEAKPEQKATKRPRVELPKPTLEVFLSSLYSQGLMALGAIESPVTGKTERRPEEASYIIDTLAMLRDKMQGNLSPQEESYLGDMLTDLRMRYVTTPNGDS